MTVRNVKGMLLDAIASVTGRVRMGRVYWAVGSRSLSFPCLDKQSAAWRTSAMPCFVSIAPFGWADGRACPLRIDSGSQRSGSVQAGRGTGGAFN